ncbi:hypothetical protein SPHFLASMR4Y_01045 [Sphingorhabdus sp. SMR4y]|nr:hypothetical protein SPHFLASMR4Y_01045 [Sphingorhabdus sp. SMR4y]
MGALHGDNESRNMRLNLQRHPETPGSAIDQITADCSLSKSGTIWLRYHAEGNVEQVKLPDVPDRSERMDNLWQQSCFELFLGQPGTEQYCEFNLSPSGNWAAYDFDRYRDGMSQLVIAKAPEIHMDFSDTHIALEATLALPEPWVAPELDAGLSAVIETLDGEKTLWALAHPGARPDFHHRDGFTLKMEAAEG